MSKDKSKIKVAILSESFPPNGGGGIDTAHYNLFQKFKENGYNVKVFTFSDDNKNTDCEDVLRNRPGKLEKRIISNFIIFYHKFRRVILRKKDKGRTAYQLYSVILSNLGSFRINKYLRNFNPGIIIVPDHGVPLYVLSKPKNSRVIHISHHNAMRFLGNPIIGFQNESDILTAVNIERKSLKKVDVVICPTNYMKDVFIKTFGENRPVKIVPNIIDEKSILGIKKNDIRESIGLTKEALLIYIPSACSRFKGSIFVFEIIRRLCSNVKHKIGFYLSGGSNETFEFQLSFLSNNVKIFRPEHLSYQRNIAIIKSCDLCITPTLIESYGMAILEANFCSVPVISFDVDGVSDLIRNGVNGLLIPYFDIETLIQSSVDLLNNKKNLDILKQNSFNYVSEKFNSDTIFSLFLDAVNP